jgi:hypothetical protein
MIRYIAIGAASLLLSGSAWAQCEPEDFEGFSLGAIVTTQIPGVTISVVPDSCGTGLAPVIASPPGGTISGTRAIATPTGCPDFSPDYLRFVFDEPQTSVSMVVGSGGFGDVYVSAYTDTGAFIDDAWRAATQGAYSYVEFNVSPATPIARIDVETSFEDFEYVDNLEFGQDTTPPEVEIDSPAFLSCVCGDDLVGIVGAVDDPDGDYNCDELWYRPVNAGPLDPWVFVSRACGAFTGTLHTLDSTPLSEGLYYVMVRGDNACGLTTADTTVIRIDRSPPGLAIAAPTENEVVCGQVELWGSASDSCGITWSITWENLSTGDTGIIVDNATGSIGNCRLAFWDTSDLPNGPYRIRLEAIDGCEHVNEIERIVEVDNTQCENCGPDLDGDGDVDVTDLLLLLAEWT